MKENLRSKNNELTTEVEELRQKLKEIELNLEKQKEIKLFLGEQKQRKIEILF